MNIKRTKFNIILLGESKVGKTSIIGSLMNKPFNENNVLTIGIDYTIIDVKFGEETYKFKIFDTAGQERYKTVSRTTITTADGILLVYAVNDKDSFDKINDWMKDIQEKVNISKKVIYLVGNKIDVNKRVISNQTALDFSKVMNIKYTETSAKTGHGIKDLFNELYSDIYEKNKESIEENIKLENSQKKKGGGCC